MIIGVIGLINLKDLINADKKILKPYKIKGIYGIYIDEELVYIGQSNNIARRWQQHKYSILKKKKLFRKNNDTLPVYKYLRNAYKTNKNIRFGVLKVVKNKKDLLTEENKYIIKFKPKYNIYY